MSLFLQKLQNHWQKGRFLSLGLDSDIAKLPKGETQLSFNQKIIDATLDLVAAYKPNAAFYESQGLEGYKVLKETIAYIHSKNRDVVVVLDAKRGDIGNTSDHYAKSVFEDLKADSVTLNPYMGIEALEPFLNYKDNGSFILCRTSNPGALEYQSLQINGEPLYIKVARDISTKWNRYKNCGLVVGATAPEEMSAIRRVAPDLPFLVPGVGAQGGDLQQTLKLGSFAQGSGFGLLINVSRAALFASANSDFPEKCREYLQKLKTPAA